MTTETFLVMAIVAVFILVVIVFVQHSRVRFYSSQWSHSEARVASWISLWKSERTRADNLQVELRMERLMNKWERQ